MFKRMTIVARKPGLSDDEFLRRWKVRHAEMVLSLPGVRGYTQNVVTQGATEQARQRPIDGFAEIWFDDKAAMAAALNTDLWAAIVADAREFLGEISGYAVEENVRRNASEGRT